MIKKRQALLLVPLAAFLLASLYGRPNRKIVGASPLAAPASLESFTDADFARHVAQLKKKLPSDKFSIVIQRPFVVIGDEGIEAVKAHSEHTVKWATDK